MGTKYKQTRGMSILQPNTRECYVTMKRFGISADNDLVLHHIFYGNKLREVSDRHGFWVWLNTKYHTNSNSAVHCKDGSALDEELKRDCQRAYELTHSRNEFISLIGKSYL